jgi:acyl carrier protein
MGLDIFDPLQRAIAKVCDLDPGEIGRSTRLEDLGVDSLAVAEVIVELEIELDRELPVHLLRELDDIETVGDVADELQTAWADSDVWGTPSTPPI